LGISDSIIRECLSGDREAWEKLLEKLSPLVFSTIYRTLDKYSFTPSLEDVDDLHNGLFLSLMEGDFRKLRQFRGISSLSSYIRIITVRQVVDFLRKQKRHLSHDSDDMPKPLVCNNPLPDKKVERADLINKVMGSLGASDKLLLRLIYEKGLTPKEISGVMNISVEAFYSKKSRVKKKIKEIMKEIGS
jgi:RNA polymerase sigma-70 factor (ECF subfamily)